MFLLSEPTQGIIAFRLHLTSSVYFVLHLMLFLNSSKHKWVIFFFIFPHALYIDGGCVRTDRMMLPPAGLHKNIKHVCITCSIFHRLLQLE